MGISTVRQIVSGVAHAIWEEMMLELMPAINMATAWDSIATGFEQRWQFPYCCRALDGKHCVIQYPPKIGSLQDRKSVV